MRKIMYTDLAKYRRSQRAYYNIIMYSIRLLRSRFMRVV